MNVASGAQVEQSIPFRQVIAFMVRSGRFYSLHFFAMAMMAMLGYAVGFWLPEVMARTYAIPVSDVGKVLGLSVMFINTFGIFVAGRICDRLTQRGLRDAPIWVCFGTAVLVVVTSALPAFMPTATLGPDRDVRRRLSLSRLCRNGSDGRQSGHAQSDARTGVGGVPVRRQPHRPGSRTVGGRRDQRSCSEGSFADSLRFAYSRARRRRDSSPSVLVRAAALSGTTGGRGAMAVAEKHAATSAHYVGKHTTTGPRRRPRADRPVRDLGTRPGRDQGRQQRDIAPDAGRPAFRRRDAALVHLVSRSRRPFA